MARSCFRLAVVAGDETTVGRIRGRLSCGPGWVSYTLQDAVADLWARPNALWDEAAETYRRRRTSLAKQLDTIGITVGGRSGLTTWIPVDDEAGIVAALLAAGWAVSPGQPFRINTAPAIRVGHATLTDTEAIAFVRDLRNILTQPRKSFA